MTAKGGNFHPVLRDYFSKIYQFQQFVQGELVLFWTKITVIPDMYYIFCFQLEEQKEGKKVVAAHSIKLVKTDMVVF